MREAMIVWGGWSGHEPEQGAHIVAGMLEEEGFKVYIENTTEAFADPAIADMSLIVPIYTMSKIEKEELDNLEKAVRGGVGLAGYHGGMCDSFRDAVNYQFMCGGQWVAHPGNVIDYRVNIVKHDDPVMEGINDFDYQSEQYYMHVDPFERGAGDHHLHGPVRAVDRGRRHAGGVEASPRTGARLLFIPRPRHQGIRGAGDAHHPPARPRLGGALGKRKARLRLPMAGAAAACSGTALPAAVRSLTMHRTARVATPSAPGLSTGAR